MGSLLAGDMVHTAFTYTNRPGQACPLSGISRGASTSKPCLKLAQGRRLSPLQRIRQVAQ